MQLFKLLVASAAIAVASAKVFFTNEGFNNIVPGGPPFVLKWSDASGPVTLVLRSDDNSKDYLVIATGVSGDSYTWSPPSTIPPGTYNFKITSGSDVNYSLQFPISGSASSISVSGTSSASATVASSSSIVSTEASTTKTATSTSASSASSLLTTSSTSSVSSASSVSGATSASSFSNSTSKVTISATSPPKTNTPTGSGVFPLSTSGSVVQYASPFALVLLSFAAIVALN